MPSQAPAESPSIQRGHDCKANREVRRMPGAPRCQRWSAGQGHRWLGLAPKGASARCNTAAIEPGSLPPVRIALFDQVVAPEAPAGSRDQRIVEQLSAEHEFTLFASAVSLEDGRMRAVAHVPVPTVRRPALASYLAYLVGSLGAYAGARARGRRFDILHVTDCYFPTADVYYAHFCHRAYLRHVWPR